MKKSQLQREPLYRQIYNLLEEKIINKELKVGEALPSETDMAVSYGVHRSSVREALRLLEENDLVGRAVGKKKLLVTAPKKDKLSKRISTTMLIDEVSVREAHEAILILEPKMAALAAERATPQIIEQLKKNVIATRESLDDLDSLTILDRNFHSLLAEAANNRVLKWSRLGMSDLFYSAERTLLSKVENSRNRLLQAHENILNAIIEGDKEAAELWARKHVDDFIRGCQTLGINMDDIISGLVN